MTSSLYERLAAWTRLLHRREDLEFRTPPQATPPLGVPAEYPEAVRELAKHAGEFCFSYRSRALTDDASGFLCLSLRGERAPAALELDGEEVPEEALYVFDGDLEGTGHTSWLVLRSRKPQTIVWSAEDRIQFDSAERYLTEGAKRGFEHGPWQRDFATGSTSSPLAKMSKSRDTPKPRLLAGLEARGATAQMAADLHEWLGAAVVLLLPR